MSKRTLSLEQFVRNGVPMPAGTYFINKKNLYVEKENHYEIYLSPFSNCFINNFNKKINIILVDKDDVKLLTQEKYAPITLNKTGLPTFRDNEQRVTVSLRRLVNGASERGRFINDPKTNIIDIRKDNAKFIMFNPFDNKKLVITIKKKILKFSKKKPVPIEYLFCYYNVPESNARIRKQVSLRKYKNVDNALNYIKDWGLAMCTKFDVPKENLVILKNFQNNEIEYV